MYSSTGVRMAAGVGLALLLAGCTLFSPQGPAETPTPLPTVRAEGIIGIEGHLMPLRTTVLALSAGGELESLPVAAGDEVDAGDLLAQLADREGAEAALAGARLERMAAQQALDDLQQGAALAGAEATLNRREAERALLEARNALRLLDTPAYRDALAAQDDAIDAAEEALDEAQGRLDETSDLPDGDAARQDAQDTYDAASEALAEAIYQRATLQSDRQRAEAALQMATAQQDEALRQENLWEDGPAPDALALAQARVDGAEAAVRAAERGLEAMTLTAPYAGTVLDLHGLETGDRVAPGVPVVTLADMSAWIVETTDLTELDVVSVAPGQTASVVPDALPEITLAGVVESIARVPTARSGDVLYTVRIRLEEGDPRLRWGMTVAVTMAE